MRIFAVTPREKQDSNEINLTPLLDVVFIMLIFFLVTASFDRESGIRAATTESTDANSGEPQVILATIDGEDRFWIDRREVDFRALVPLLLTAHTANPDFPLVIETHADSSAQALVTLLDAASAAGLPVPLVAGGPGSG